MLHIFILTVAELLLYDSLYEDTRFTAGKEAQRSELQCFETVKHYFSNPKITGEIYPIYSFKNDDFVQMQLSLSCPGMNFVEIVSIALSLPVSYDTSYCVESQRTDFSQCSQMKQCNCCEIPQDRCSHYENVTEFARGCYMLQNCTITVWSKFLFNCPGRMYGCENKKCHSRWVEVNYICQPYGARVRVQGR